MADPKSAQREAGTIYHWDPGPEATTDLVVLWEATRCPPDFIQAPENVVCVAIPPGYTEFRYALTPFDDPLAQSWRGQLRGASGLMFVAMLPPKHAIDIPEGAPWPTKAKIVGERMAVYWRFVVGGESVEPRWRIRPAEDLAHVLDSCRIVNQRPSPPEPPEPPVPSDAVRQEWAETPRELRQGKPHESTA